MRKRSADHTIITCSFKRSITYRYFNETISWITEHASLDEQDLKKMINNKLQAQMACKAAVKAGDSLTQEKMEQLLRDLEKQPTDSPALMADQPDG